MKNLLLISLFLMSAICYGQELYLKISEVPSKRIYKGVINYDTLEKGQGVVYRLLITDEGIRDTTKQIVIKYEAFQIEPATQVDTIDSEQLTYSATWTRHGVTATPGWYMKTIAYSGVGEASYTFTGTKLEIFGERGLNNGSAAITVGNVTQTVSFKGTQLLPFKAFSITVPRGTYPVTIKPIGDGNVLLDYIVVTK